MAAAQASPYELKPFSVTPASGLLSSASSTGLALCGVPIIAAALVATLIEGTFGRSTDFQLREDVERIVSRNVAPDSHPSFPLLRDVTSLIFIIVITLTCIITHRQWRLMQECLPKLVSSGALDPSAPGPSRRIHRLLGLNRLLADVGVDWRLKALVGRVNSFLARAGKLWGVVAVVSVVLALLLTVGEHQNGLFLVLAPNGLGPTERHAWQQAAYSSWWASTDHPFGYVVYVAAASFGIFAILLQNIVGGACAYIVISLPAVARMDVDWLNRDGSYGWLPIARIYRTVRWSLALHGTTLSIALVMLGVSNFPWIVSLVIIWATVVPLYAVVPIALFRRVAAGARAQRIERIVQLADPDTIPRSDFARLQLIRTEIDYVNAAVIKPLSIRRGEIPGVLALVFLPVVLTVAQILFSVSFGGQ